VEVVALDARMQRATSLTFFEYLVLSALSEQPERTLRMQCLTLFREHSVA
jgi:hypothetical protein